MKNKYFMVDQIKPKDKIRFPGSDLLMMSSGMLFSVLMVISASILYVR